MKRYIYSIAILACIAGGIFIFNACSNEEEQANDISTLPKTISTSGQTANKYWNGNEKDLLEIGCVEPPMNCSWGEITVHPSALSNIVDACDRGNSVQYFTDNREELYHYFAVELVNGVINRTINVRTVHKEDLSRVGIIFTNASNPDDSFVYLLDN
jgi:hypothetical protein